jgi:hypothetical protein
LKGAVERPPGGDTRKKWGARPGETEKNGTTHPRVGKRNTTWKRRALNALKRKLKYLESMNCRYLTKDLLQATGGHPNEGFMTRVFRDGAAS